MHDAAHFAQSGERSRLKANIGRMRALAPVLFALTVSIAVPVAAATPSPSPSPKATPHKNVVPKLPPIPLHSEFTVEVNDKGQVVRVKTAKGTGNVAPFFNAQTYGNVLQMWIRHPDGTAETGLYKVTYDYDPKTHKIHRGITLLQAGGDWANAKGAATEMVDTANREAQEEAQKQHDQEQQQGNYLPPLNSIVGSPTPSPSASP
jgi:hypothetical protein